MTDLNTAMLIIRDRGREVQLLERCLRLEQEAEHLRTAYKRRRPHADAADLEIIRLRDMKHLTFRQIGAQMGMPMSTVGYRYRRACGTR